MAWALAHHRIFNARQVLVLVAQRIAILLILALSAWGLAIALQLAVPSTAAWVISFVVCGLGIFWLDDKTRLMLGLNDEFLLAAFRSEIIHHSRVAADSERLTRDFETLLARRFDARSAAILGPDGEVFAGGGRAIRHGRPGFAALRDAGWITPESLQRRRPSAALEDLGLILQEQSIAALVTVPRGSPTPALLIALGPKRNEWPFTYPEIRQLQNVSDLIDNILTRSRLTDQAALQARLEHLAMMSRGLAHDLKNLLTPVASFLVHTDGYFTPGSPASEVHESARRSIRIMNEYIRDALFFADNLKPRLESIELGQVLRQVREATATRAAGRGVSLTVGIAGVSTMVADGVLLHRLLANLVNNAIDASPSGSTVRLTAGAGQPGWVRLQIADEGCGIAPEVRDRIFEPYFTTKEFGTDIRGFGLGLTVAQKACHLHGGTIVFDSKPGGGTVFTVELPVAPASDADTMPAPAVLSEER